MMSKYQGCIYKLTCKITGMSYIGQTVRPLKKRIQAHCSTAKKSRANSHITNAIKVYGITNFIIEELCNVFNKAYLNDLERYFINEYSTITPNGYNLTSGGDSKIEFCQETKNKMSKSRQGIAPWNKGIKWPYKHWALGKKRGSPSEATRNKMRKFGKSNHFYGKRHSKETLEKLSKSLKGRKVWNKTQGPFVQLDKDLNLIKVFNDIKDIVNAGWDWKSVRRAMRNNKTYKGYYFKLKEEYESIRNAN